METTSNTATMARALQILYVPSCAANDALRSLVENVFASLDNDVVVQQVDDLASTIEMLDREPIDAIVVAYSEPSSEAISALDLGLAFASDYPVIVLTADDVEERTQQLLADGAVECIAAGSLRPGQLELAVRRAIARYQAVDRSYAPTQPTPSSRTMRRAVHHAAAPGKPLLAATPSALSSPVHPNSLRRRSLSGILIGVILLAAVGIGAHRFWTTFFRYDAYGVVVGRAIDVSAPWEGQVKYVHVEEGQNVRQGDVLITIENLGFRRELEELDDELSVANAELRSKVSELKWNASYMKDVNAQTYAKYYETWGELLEGHENVIRLRAAYERAQELNSKKYITVDDFEKTKYDLRGQLQKIEKLKQAVSQLRTQVESAEGMSDLGTDQLRPLSAKILAIKTKRKALRSQIEEGQLRSPVNGTVLRRNSYAGERCDTKNPVLTVVEETSARVIVYYPQKSRHIPVAGDKVTLQLPPHAYPLECVVERVGDSFEPAPNQIARHYSSDEKLLPVRMKPIGEQPQNDLRLGAVVMLPKSHSDFLSSAP